LVASVDVIGAAALSRPPIPAPVPESLAEETGYLLRRAYVHAGEWMTAALPAGIPVRHYEVLQSLADLGPRSQRDLAELLWVNRTIMVKLVDALEREGLVERRRDPVDRRSYALELTAAGRHALADLSAAVDRAEAGFVEPLTGDEHATLRAQLAEIASAAGEHPAGLARRITSLLSPAHHRIRERVTERLQPLGLTTALWGVLATIAARGPTSQQAIADQLGLTGPAILQTVDRLQALGLVERRRDPDDRRSYALEPTERGDDALRQGRAAIGDIHDDLDAALGGAAERRELNRLLRVLLSQRSTERRG
jgi:DNA-binding MarR family transcriptional regulator